MLLANKIVPLQPTKCKLNINFGNLYVHLTSIITKNE